MSQDALVTTKLAGKSMGVIGLSRILILKTSLKMRRKSTSNKRKFFLRPKGIFVTRKRVLSKEVNNGGRPPFKVE